ncbi:hypothetical protein [Streptococcus uberis]|uniref:hypothetical protein n=1 Tax=Streptococcus uberis TaxID=1349 RepID=UPI001EF015F5|nr:hypothetical protein [Streptococcus uberis]MCK1204048.1 hypothetical protein [Streptococcus uberis]
MMDNLINELVTLTIEKKIKWNTIDHLFIDGHAYSDNFQHIIANKSFYTNYQNKIVIVLYGEVRDFWNQRTVSNFFIQFYSDGKIEKLKFDEHEIVKLHTLITLTF